MKSLILAIISAVFFTAPVHAINLDNEVCALFQGTTCGEGVQMMLINMRDGNNDTNRARCTSLPLICKAPDLDTWIRMYSESGSGRRGYESAFSWNTTPVDQKGNLGDAVGKTFVRCFKKRGGADWETQIVDACPVPAPEPCANGKRLVNNQCQEPDSVFDMDNSNSVHTAQVAATLHQLAAQHNNTTGQVIVNPDQAAVQVGVNPGVNGNLSDVGSLGSSGSGSSSGDLSGSSSGVSKKISSGSSSGDVDPTTARSGFANSFSDSGEGQVVVKEAQKILSALQVPVTPGEVEAAVKEASSMLKLQGQSVYNPNPLGGKAGSKNADSEGSGKIDVKSTKRAPSSKSSADPEDYFTRIGLNSSLFKIVTHRLREQQANWILDSKNKRAPDPIESARDAGN